MIKNKGLGLAPSPFLYL